MLIGIAHILVDYILMDFQNEYVRMEHTIVI